MIEIAVVDVHEGEEQAFLHAYRAASGPYYASAGCRGERLLQSTATTSRFAAVVEWDDVAAHEAARATEAGKHFVEAVSPFMRVAPDVQEFRPI